MSGAFQAAAVSLHERGLVVIPTSGDDGKSPLVLGWNRWRGQRRATVESFARRYPEANIGIVTGLSRLTVIDADDEKTLADAEGRFGKSPIVARSPRGGGHLYFRSTGERNANLRAFGLNVDVRGVGGMVLAPPSERAGIGAYRLERGAWDDLARLPALLPGSIPGAEPKPEPKRIEAANEGERNNQLFDRLRYVAQDCHSFEDLLTEAHAINAQFSPCLPRAEAVKVARSVWNYKAKDQLYTRQNPAIRVSFTELEELDSDALKLLLWLRRWHGAKQGGGFALVTKAMARDRVIPGWGARRYEVAILELCKAGRIERTYKGGKCRGDPSKFRLCVKRAT